MPKIFQAHRFCYGSNRMAFGNARRLTLQGAFQTQKSRENWNNPCCKLRKFSALRVSRIAKITKRS